MTRDTVIEARQMLERGEQKAWVTKQCDAVLLALREYEHNHRPYVPPPDPPSVEEQFAKVREKWPTATLESRQFVNGSFRFVDHLVTIPNFLLPAGYDRPTCTVYFVLPDGYPFAEPERFYTDRLRMKNGAPPYMARELVKSPSMGIEEKMRLFPAPEGTMIWFWKVNSWDHRRDTLRSYVNVIKARLDNVDAGERRHWD